MSERKCTFNMLGIDGNDAEFIGTIIGEKNKFNKKTNKSEKFYTVTRPHWTGNLDVKAEHVTEL